MPDNKTKEFETTRHQGNRMLLGVTGSIATGKSTVADMLAERGALMIDFDVLAREVVEPGEPAWQEITDFFGSRVLNEDRTLNRKALSAVIFNEPEKREKLEQFTHPRIQERFVLQLDRITLEDPDAVVQAVVPLLIEVNMQNLFQKLLVVYTSPEVQIKRLMDRDNLSRLAALRMLNSQIPIDEKVTYADYVIYNDNSLEDTRRQVDELWATLQKTRITDNGSR